MCHKVNPSRLRRLKINSTRLSKPSGADTKDWSRAFLSSTCATLLSEDFVTDSTLASRVYKSFALSVFTGLPSAVAIENGTGSRG